MHKISPYSLARLTCTYEAECVDGIYTKKGKRGSERGSQAQATGKKKKPSSRPNGNNAEPEIQGILQARQVRTTQSHRRREREKRENE